MKFDESLEFTDRYVGRISVHRANPLFFAASKTGTSFILWRLGLTFLFLLVSDFVFSQPAELIKMPSVGMGQKVILNNAVALVRGNPETLLEVKKVRIRF